MSRRSKQRTPPPPPPRRWLWPAVGGSILAVAVLAVVLSQVGLGSSGTDTSTPHPSVAAGGSADPAAPAVITGTALPPFANGAPDAAVGLVAPVVRGHDDAGNAASIEPTGSPVLAIFAAHWCPHCQRELPAIQAWIDGGGLPDDVAVRTVSTGIDPSLPNYPPAAWFERIDWSSPVITDPTGSVAGAYGLSAYPFFVFLDGEGRVVARATGELAPAAIEEALAAIPR